MQMIETRNRRTVEVEQYVALFELRTRGGSICLNLEHENGRLQLSLQRPLNASIERDCLASEPEAAPAYTTFTHQRRRDVRCDVDADRETDSLRTTGDGGVDADHAAAAVDEGAAGVAGIQRSIGLNHAFHEPARAGSQAATERADDSSGHCCLVAKWI